eukprot:gnl/MRDRNA2_/MRDRNA2_61379_c0_seq1.p1 gnl/MRDRNA2_/MRDRNA2_61379_c0~~gnl/MRDRNA2_/MRDRNA2_61379_c0_seq1.p1  ORF type:complete len:583 (-),score=65.21 gnl/MRDRNA2_/MRDRNA2_61379_c0_seq1:167-1915(-)
MAVLSESEVDNSDAFADCRPDVLQSAGSASSSSATLRRPSSAPSLQRPVQEILNIRRKLDTEGVPYCRSMDFNSTFRDLESSLHDACSTHLYNEFCRRSRINQGVSCKGCSVKTFFDLRCYIGKDDLLETKVSGVEEDEPDFNEVTDPVTTMPAFNRTIPALHRPGGLMVLYSFYVQLYSKLKQVRDHQCINGAYSVGLVKAEDIGIFDPVDPSSQLTFLDMLNLANDLEIIPNLISRTQLQTAYSHVHPAKSIDDIFVHSGLTLDQFTELMVIIADMGYHDVNRYRLTTKIQRVKQLIKYLNLKDVGTLQRALSDHWWRRSRTSQNFAEVGSVVLRERHAVKPKRMLQNLPPERHIDSIADEKALRSFTELMYLPQIHNWSAFRSSVLDMGIMRIGTYHNFRVLVKNEASHMMEFSINVKPHTNALHIHTPDRLQGGVAPGTIWDIMIVAHPLEESEWSGFVNILGKCHNGAQYSIRIPGYLRGVGAKDKHPRAGLLPKKAPGSIHRRGDRAEALLKQDLTPGVLMRECIGLENAGVPRPMGGVLSQRKMLSRRITHVKTHPMPRSKSLMYISTAGKTLTL